MRQALLVPLLATLACPAAEEPGGELRLMDLSLDVMSAVGGSTASDRGLEPLQAGGHDPHRRGFTFQQAELSAAGAVDPYFRAEAHLVLLDDDVELEEAFAQTTSLTAGLQVEAGLSLAEFGRNNPTHPHTWAWVDRPVVVSRLLGGDGMRGVGTRLGWLTPLPWYSQVHAGVMDATNPVATSFGGKGEDPGAATVGGRGFVPVEVHSPADLVWLLRWENAIDLTAALEAKAGVSFLAGPNATGPDGRTRVYGVDLAVKWQPEGGRQGYPYVTIEGEAMRRDYVADGQVLPGPVTVPGATLHDWGFYLQSVYGFSEGWAAGLRCEAADGTGDSVDGGGAPLSHEADPARDRRTRLSPLLTWNPTHFSKLRLQYSYDRFTHADDGGDDHAHSVWLGLEVLIGAHPAHAF
jgi:hypothetical protein